MAAKKKAKKKATNKKATKKKVTKKATKKKATRKKTVATNKPDPELKLIQDKTKSMEAFNTAVATSNELLKQNQELMGGQDKPAPTEQQLDKGAENLVNQQSPPRAETLAKNNIVSSQQKNPMEPMEMEDEIGESGDVEFADLKHEDDEPSLIIPAKGDLDDPMVKQQFDYEQFMAMPVKVMIQTTNEEDAQDVFDISVNGRTVMFHRGETKTVPRYIVEGLARAKPSTFKNVEYTDEDQIRKVKWPSTSGLRHPFSVIQDQHPRGPDWLAHVLRQP